MLLLLSGCLFMKVGGGEAGKQSLSVIVKKTYL